MNLTIKLLCLGTIIFFSHCVSENIEEKYASKIPTIQTQGEIAWFPLNGNLNDSTGNQTMISVAGTIAYTAGVNEELGQGLRLNGTNNYLIVSPGVSDTIAILFWLKSANANGIVSPNKPVMFDYGHKAATASLVDATSAATHLNIKHGSSEVSSSEMGEENYLNTYNGYSLFYFVSTGNLAAFTFQCYIDGVAHKISNQYNFNNIIKPQSDLIYIGRSSAPDEAGNSFFNGSIDEIHLFNRALSSSELNYYLQIQPE